MSPTPTLLREAGPRAVVVSVELNLEIERLRAVRVPRHNLLAASNNGAIRVWQPDGEHHAQLWRQLRLARRELLPGGKLAWHVDEKEGHDDHLLSLALALRAAGRGRPRIARSRPNRP